VCLQHPLSDKGGSVSLALRMRRTETAPKGRVIRTTRLFHLIMSPTTASKPTALCRCWHADCLESHRFHAAAAPPPPAASLLSIRRRIAVEAVGLVALKGEERAWPGLGCVYVCVCVCV
jgi:hypothetical protein